MAVLVTGGAGFIGSHFIELLLAQTDEQVVCLDNYNDYYDPRLKRQNVEPFQKNPRVTMVDADFCDAAAMRRLFDEQPIQQVMHLGAYAGVRPSVERALTYVEANVMGTAALLEAARHKGVQRFVFASSSTVYGEGAAAPFREDAPQGVAFSPYGASKQAAENLCRTYQILHDLPMVICRPFSVYGPRLRPDLAMSIFTRAVLEGEPLPLFGDGSILRDFTHIHDICTGFYLALVRDEAVGEAFNLGNDQPIKMNKLIALIEQAAGKPAVIDYRPAVPGEMPVTHADLSKSRKLLGYHPTVPIAEGVREFVDWYRSANT